MLEKLREKNKPLSVYDINNDRFKKFGRVLHQNHFIEAINYLKEHTTIPPNGNQYIAHDETFEKTLSTTTPYLDVFGHVKLQYGYVNGHNQKLNALEYHKSSEINIAESSFVLLLGSSDDIRDNTFDTKQITAFYVPQGTVIEIYPRTLHFSPCKVMDSGFKCGVILSYSTNMSFVHSSALEQNEDRLLFKTNKWLLCHQEHQKFVDLGAHIGILGTNYKINY
ncbi:MAG: DUF4867 family protein [Candidatus Izimaplasma sp.]|nr:DUF4867 family protein [Candidatus Izimaplasma bacterium]